MSRASLVEVDGYEKKKQGRVDRVFVQTIVFADRIYPRNDSHALRYTLDTSSSLFFTEKNNRTLVREFLEIDSRSGTKTPRVEEGNRS